MIVWPLRIQNPILRIWFVYAQTGAAISPYGTNPHNSSSPAPLCIGLQCLSQIPTSPPPFCRSQLSDRGYWWLQPSPPLELSTEFRYGVVFPSFEILKASLHIYFFNACTAYLCICVSEPTCMYLHEYRLCSEIVYAYQSTHVEWDKNLCVSMATKKNWKPLSRFIWFLLYQYVFKLLQKSWVLYFSIMYHVDYADAGELE